MPNDGWVWILEEKVFSTCTDVCFSLAEELIFSQYPFSFVIILVLYSFVPLGKWKVPFAMIILSFSSQIESKIPCSGGKKNFPLILLLSLNSPI